jgi:phage protein D
MEFSEIERKNLNFYAPRFEILIDGENILYRGVEIVSVIIRNNLNGPDDFSITINNPELKWLEDPLFQLGKEAEIKMGYGRQLTPMIIGEISALEPSFSPSGPLQMGIRGFDLLKRLQRGDKFRSWENLPDFVIAGIIALDHGLLPDGIQPTLAIHPKIMQNGESDFDFLKRRAQENGFEMFVHLRTLYFRKPKEMKEPITTLTLGKTLNSFAPELNVANKPSQVTVRGWDPRSKKEIIGIVSQGQELGLELKRQSASQIIQSLYGTVERSIREPIYSYEEAEKRARSVLDNASDQFIKGSGECLGIPEIRAGSYINIEGLGKQFSMKYYLESTTHKIDTSGYTTEFSVKGNAL